MAGLHLTMQAPALHAQSEALTQPAGAPASVGQSFAVAHPAVADGAHLLLALHVVAASVKPARLLVGHPPHVFVAVPGVHDPA
jgi:hypothetical protein